MSWLLNKKYLKVLFFSLTFVLVVLALLTVYLFQQNKKLKSKIDQQIVPAIEIPTPTISDIINILEIDLSNGWYWGDKNQKKPGTPDNWVYNEAGKSSCWHKVGIGCRFSPEPNNTYKCPENGLVNCMPILDEARQKACSPQAMEWYKTNCPNFQGGAL